MTTPSHPAGIAEPLIEPLPMLLAERFTQTPYSDSVLSDSDVNSAIATYQKLRADVSRLPLLAERVRELEAALRDAYREAWFEVKHQTLWEDAWNRSAAKLALESEQS